MTSSERGAWAPEVHHPAGTPEAVPRQYNTPFYNKEYVHSGSQPAVSYQPSNVHYPASQPVSNAQSFDHSRAQMRDSRHCGCSDFVLGILLGALIATVVVGAALGGGLGSQLSKGSSSASSSSSSNTITTTPSLNPSSTSATSSPSSTSTSGTMILLENYVGPVPSTINTLSNNCSSATLTNLFGHSFIPTCKVAFNPSLSAKQGGTVADISGLLAYSFTDCLTACSSLNLGASVYGFTNLCRSVTYYTRMREMAASSVHVNCFLKNASLANLAGAPSDDSAMSATLAGV